MESRISYPVARNGGLTTEELGELLDVPSGWVLVRIERDIPGKSVTLHLEAAAEALRCPECGRVCRCHDRKDRTWRHRDWLESKVHLRARVPRVICPRHGTRQVEVPWADPMSRMTASFEAWAIELMKEMAISAAARQLRLSWDEAAGVQSRAVKRGLARKPVRCAGVLHVDETSFRRGHRYVTLVSDSGGRAFHVGEGRGRKGLDPYLEGLSEEERNSITAVAMDMHAPYEASVRDHAEALIMHDKFHVIAHASKSVDEVRKAEHRKLAQEGDSPLAGSKWLWLKNFQNLSDRQRERFNRLRALNLKVGRAWSLCSQLKDVWAQTGTPDEIQDLLLQWASWAKRSRLEPMAKTGRMVENRMYGIVAAIDSGITNASAESLNSRVQKIKARACGYRNLDGFINAIYFHFGGLDMTPQAQYAAT